MIGIYKITSPSKRIYIGYAKDIASRWNDYYRLHNCNGQKRLYRSFLKYGIINHTFEIVEECLFEELAVRERYWQDFYNVIGEFGLNCYLTKTDEKPQELSPESKQQISNTLRQGYQSGEIPHPRFNKGRLFNVYDFKGNLLIENQPIQSTLKFLNITNTSTLNGMLRKNRYVIAKQYVVMLNTEQYLTYLETCINYVKGEIIPIYQIHENGDIIRCTSSSITRVKQKVLNSENFIYYSKKNKSYYTFIGLINNAVQIRNSSDNEESKTVKAETLIPC